MLTLDPASVCDVCADDYGPFNLPRCIPCGHVLCEKCAGTIVQKTLPRQKPACPYCRDPFTTDDVRVIRIDFTSTSGGGASGSKDADGEHAADDDDTLLGFNAIFKPDDDAETILYTRSRSRSSSAVTSRATSLERSRSPSVQPPHFKPLNEDEFQEEEEDAVFPLSNIDPIDFQTVLDPSRHKAAAKKLEDRIQRVASKRCSVEEVQNLQRALTEWLALDLQVGGDEQQRKTLSLSCALLRAILMNHVAHAEAAKVAKGVEMSLRARLAEAGCDPGEPTGNLLAAAQAELKQALLAPGRTTPAPTRRRASVSASAPTSPDGYSFATANSYAFTQGSQTRSRNHSRNHTLSSAQFNHGVSSAPGSGSNSASSSGRTTPTVGLLSVLSPPGVGTSSASAAAAATISKDKNPRSRTTSLYSSYSTTTHRPTTPTPLPRSNSSSGATSVTSSTPVSPPIAHAHSMSATSSSRDRRSMTPGPARSSHAVSLGHHRSASVAPGASPSLIPPAPRGSIDRGTPQAPTSSASAAAAALGTPTKHHPNGSASVGGYLNVLHADYSNAISISRPPVPPKPRTLSGNSGSPPRQAPNSQLHSRGVIDDRGIESDRETIMSAKTVTGQREGKERRGLKHERWFPAMTGILSRKPDSPMRPATSMN